MKNKELFAIKKTEKDFLIGFVNSFTNVKGGKAKILSEFKEDRSKLMFEDDFLILENGKQFSEKVDECNFITNRCSGTVFTPSTKKYIAIKKELFQNFDEVFTYYCKKRNIEKPNLYCVKQLKLNGFQRIYLYEVDSNDFTMFHFPRYIQSVNKAKEAIANYFKENTKVSRFFKVKNGVKIEL